MSTPWQEQGHLSAHLAGHFQVELPYYCHAAVVHSKIITQQQEADKKNAKAYP